MTAYGGVVVPATPLRPPQLSLVLSALRPDDTSDPALDGLSEVQPDQLAALPTDLRDELLARKGAAWVRGFEYAPENHTVAALRDACDSTTVDAPAITAPTGLAAVAQPTGGTQTAGLKTYTITASNGNGETTTSASATATTVLNGAVVLTWDKVENLTYKVYGRVAGSLGLIGVVGPLDALQAATFTDPGTPAPGAAAPMANTTGGPGTYGNAPIVRVVPYIIEAQDACSTFGFEARDYKGRASRLLENATPRAIEREWWTGALAQAKGYPNGYLDNSASYTDLTPGGGAPSVARGHQILQNALASCGFGGQGMIHCQPQTSPDLQHMRRVTTARGDTYQDMFGNVVVIGSGYPGTSALGGGATATTAVIFATDLVSVRIDPQIEVFPDTFAEAVDRGQNGQPNKVTFRAERFGCAYADLVCHFGVRVTLPS